MDFGLLAKGLAIGLSIAAPVGPIGVLCIRRTCAEGRLVGLVSGLGAATADTVYGLIGALGLTFVSGFLLRQQTWLRLAGGLFLLYLGARIFLARAADPAAPGPGRGRGLLAAYTSTLVLTLTNPVTILFFAGIFAGLGLAGRGGDYGSAVLLVTGVFLGSALWWVTLSGVVGLLRSRFDARVLRWVNRLSGVVVAGFGVAALFSLAG